MRPSPVTPSSRSGVVIHQALYDQLEIPRLFIGFSSQNHSICRRVLYVSLHRGNGFYPGTGAATDVGKDVGAGFSVNVSASPTHTFTSCLSRTSERHSSTKIRQSRKSHQISMAGPRIDLLCSLSDIISCQDLFCIGLRASRGILWSTCSLSWIFWYRYSESTSAAGDR